MMLLLSSSSRSNRSMTMIGCWGFVMLFLYYCGRPVQSFSASSSSLRPNYPKPNQQQKNGNDDDSSSLSDSSSTMTTPLPQILNTTTAVATTSTTTTTTSTNQNIMDYYASYWDALLVQEYREMVDALRQQRQTWSRTALEQQGIRLSGIPAVPDSELLGDKIVRVSQDNHNNNHAASSMMPPWRDLFTRGDVLLLTPQVPPASQFNKYASLKRMSPPLPKECLVVDVGKDWMTLGVGPTWPEGCWESRRATGSATYRVCLDRSAPQAPLRAQRAALDRVRRGPNQKAGSVVPVLAATFASSNHENGNTTTAEPLASQLPRQFQHTLSIAINAKHEQQQQQQQQDTNEASTLIQESIQQALTRAIRTTGFTPNDSQARAITWALQRQISCIRGPPGTGKTKTACLLIATALELFDSMSALTTATNDGTENSSPNPSSSPRRVLAVTHSNGAADVLLEGLLQMGVPAVRLGRPATVSSHLHHRTIVAMAEKMPAVVQLRQQLANANVTSSQEGSAVAFALKQVTMEMQQLILSTAPVVVTSCIGAHQLVSSSSSSSSTDTLQDETKDGRGNAAVRGTAKVEFPLVVLDEAAQTTEPALVCALVAARAEQLILVGDTRQLPPTITSMKLVDTLGVSPMARLERCGVGEVTLQVQYRMPESLLRHPSQYFYKGLVTCAPDILASQKEPPAGFPWPSAVLEPLAFVQCGNGDSEHPHSFGGRSNPTEANAVIRIVANLLAAGDVEASQLAIISPYAKQVQLIRSELSNIRNAKEVRVGTVDSFQGQETDVVVFSAVRSNPLKELGFLRDSRRLCVAITRARRGLIIVGDQGTLKACRHWESLIESCQERGCVMKEGDLTARQNLDRVDSVEDLFAEEDILKRLFGEDDELFGEDDDILDLL